VTRKRLVALVTLAAVALLILLPVGSYLGKRYGHIPLSQLGRNTPSQRILGKWTAIPEASPDDPATFDFRSDGKLIITHQGDPPDSGKYRVQGGHLYLTRPDAVTTATLKWLGPDKFVGTFAFDSPDDTESITCVRQK